MALVSSCGCVLELQKSLSRSPALALRQPLPVPEGRWGERREGWLVQVLEAGSSALGPRSHPSPLRDLRELGFAVPLGVFLQKQQGGVLDSVPRGPDPRDLLTPDLPPRKHSLSGGCCY